MGEECSNCKNCNDKDKERQQIRKIDNNLRPSSRVVTNVSRFCKVEITPPKGDNARNAKKYKRKERRKSSIESIKFNEKDKKNFEKEVRNSIGERRRGSTGSLDSLHMSDDESAVSISNRLFINEINDLPSKKYKIISEIGSGSFGKVYLAENILTNEEVAMKQIMKSSEDLLSDGEIKDEIEILKNLDHPDIVKINEFYNTQDSYVLITEYCPGGELYDQVKNQLSETQIAVIFRQLLSGLAYLHSNNIVHRDLKLENILINEVENSKTTGEELFNIKIIDFGTARIFNKGRNPQSIVGSSYYIAPEVLRQNYNKECDLWSVGVILYMFIVGRAPFDGYNEDEIIESITQGEYKKDDKRWIKASREVKDLIQKLLVYEPEKRLTAIEALRHPWFKVTDSNILYDNVPKEKILECIRNLLTYNINSKLEELVLAYIIHNMPRPKDAKYAIKLFKLVNEIGDGKLQKKELKKTLLNFVSEEFLSDYDEKFSLLDGDNSGFIDYEEFLRATLDRRKILTDDILIYAFNYFDVDKSGYIKKKKMKSYFIGTKITDKTFQSIFDEIDLDRDGKINFSEFKGMLLY